MSLCCDNDNNNNTTRWRRWRTAWQCRRCFFFSEQQTAVAVSCWRYLTVRSELAYLKSLMWIWTTTNGFKPHCLSEREGWGSTVLRRWHLPPFWHQPHRHLLFSNPFSPTVSTCWKTSPWHPLRLGGHLCPARPALPTKNSIKYGISHDEKSPIPGLFKSSWWRRQSQAIGCCIPHSGHWLHAPPIASVGLRLSDEAIRVPVAHRLGCKACEPHTCPCSKWEWSTRAKNNTMPFFMAKAFWLPVTTTPLIGF